MDMHEFVFFIRSLLSCSACSSWPQEKTLLGSMQTPVECVLCVCGCVAVEFVCLDDGWVLYSCGVYSVCACVLSSLGGGTMCVCVEQRRPLMICECLRAAQPVLLPVWHFCPLKRWNTLFTDKVTCRAVTHPSFTHTMPTAMAIRAN